MKYPCVVQRRMCKTEVELIMEQEGLNVYGEPLEAFHWKGKANYQDSAKTVFTDDKKLIQISGKMLIPGDIAPDIPNITSGEAVVHGEHRSIFRGTKARNPDGTVNFTEVLLK